MKRYSGLHDKLCMIGVFILKVKKKILNLKYNILWLKINLKMILLELYAV